MLAPRYKYGQLIVNWPLANSSDPSVVQYKTWTLDSGLDHGLDSGLNNGLNIGLEF